MTSEDTMTDHDFINSWDAVEAFYGKYEEIAGWDIRGMRTLVSQLRAKGYDGVLRAYTSHFDLVLTRTRHFALDSTPRVRVSANPKFGIWVKLPAEEVEIASPEWQINSLIEAYIDRLVALSIDEEPISSL